MNGDDICRFRLAGQYLTRRGPRRAADVVRALGAVQAQEYLPAKWGVAQRTTGATNAEIEEDVAAGRILRTHVLRPTWHFVAPEDIRWMLALTGPRVAAMMSSYNRKLGLDAKVFRRSHDAIARALAGGTHLTRRELAGAVKGARVDTTGTQRLAHLVMQAELDAVVTSGPRRGKQSTYALMDERVPPARPRDRDDALGELARRYFATRSPATAHDFAWWSGLTMADARRAIDIAGPALAERAVGDRPYWVSRGAPRSRTRKLSVHLLPAYDEYFIGFKDRSAIAQRLGSAALVSGGNALIGNVVTVDGQLVGRWKGDERTTVSFNRLSRLTRDERVALERQVARFGRFLGMATE